MHMKDYLESYSYVNEYVEDNTFVHKWRMGMTVVACASHIYAHGISSWVFFLLGRFYCIEVVILIIVHLWLQLQVIRFL